MLRRLLTIAGLPIVILAAALIVAAPSPSGALAAAGTISVTPGTQTVAPGASFTITLTQHSDGPTTGAEATISFDPGLIQLQDAQLGADYAAATLIIGAVPGGDTGNDEGNPQTVEEAIAEANTSGALKNVTGFFTPGSGTAPGGDVEFLTITAQAIGASGSSPIGLSKLEMLDDQYNGLAVTGVDGFVELGGSGAPVGTAPAAAPTAGGTQTSSTPGAAPAGSPTARTGSTSVLAASNVPTLKTASLSVSPSTLKVAKESTFSIDLKATLDGAVGNAQAKVSFKKDLVSITKLTPGPGWKADSAYLDSAIADANQSGELNVTLTADKTQPPPVGEGTALTVTMQGRPGKEGKSAIKFVTSDITGSTGGTVDLTTADGEVTVGSPGGGSMLLIIIAIVAVLVIAGGAGAAVMVRRNRASA